MQTILWVSSLRKLFIKKFDFWVTLVVALSLYPGGRLRETREPHVALGPILWHSNKLKVVICFYKKIKYV